MHVKRGWLWAVLAIIRLTIAPPAEIAANDWFGVGGTHDGDSLWTLEERPLPGGMLMLIR